VILVDSSVWISYLNGKNTKEAEFLSRFIGVGNILMTDLIFTEILQGYRDDSGFNDVKSFLDEFPFVIMGSQELALKSAQNYRFLRKNGITIRKTIDSYIATYCIEKDMTILHSDKDFEPFVEHLGLKSIF
jgi:predicted nucleic acid-binding protein